MKKLQTIALCLLVAFMSCDKDDSPSNNNNPDPDPTAFAENFGNEISRNFLGRVIDKDRNPIQDVTVTIGNKTAQTDANGVFIISDAPVHERFGYVKAEKVGYLHGSRSVVPSTGTNKVTIMMLEENIVGTTNSGISETIALPNGASVALEGNYKKEDGTAYSGSVNVIMHHLDPADDDMQDQMPGMLYAANAQNEERMLQTFGMLAVELRGSGGETLNLADGSSAEIKVPLDASLMVNAPSTIPLWHFDESYGYWVEDGQANLVGNAYVGTVTHFSFWNCDIPAEYVDLCINFTNEDGVALGNLDAVITSSVYGSRGGNSNGDGIVCGMVPKNETLLLEVFNFDICGSSSILSSTIGPFSSDSSIDIVIPNSPDMIQEAVIGNFNMCVGNPIISGYVELKYGYTSYFDQVDDGTFELNLIRCNADYTFKLKAYDYVNLQETDSIVYTFTTPITNVGSLTSCNAITEFITYQVNDNIPVVQFSYIYAGILQANAVFQITTEGNNEYFVFTLPSFTGTGSYTETSDGATIYFNDAVNGEYDAAFESSIVFNVTTYGEIGEYIDINFSGSYPSASLGPANITGTIHVLRDQ